MSVLQFDREDYFKETDCLLELIKNSLGDRNYHEIFTNLIIIDLVISLETCIERSLESFILNLKLCNINAAIINERLKNEHLKYLLNEALKHSKHDHKIEKFSSSIKEISECFSGKILSELYVDLKLGMGKHGEKEILNLFRKLGFENIFENILIPVASDSLLEEKSYLDLELFIQELTQKRNIAIHNGNSFHSRYSIHSLENLAKNLEIFLKTMVDILNFVLCFYQNRNNN